MEQVLRFCTAPDGVRIAWSSIGHGTPIVKAAHWMTHLEHDLRSPVWRPWVDALSAGHRLVRYDQRGCGLSDREPAHVDFDAHLADFTAVVDDAGLDRFAIFGLSQGAAVAVRYAVLHPERVTCLILCGGYARGWRRRGPADLARHELLQEVIRVGWGTDDLAFRRLFTQLFVPGGTQEQLGWFDELARVTASPDTAARLRRGWGDFDTTDDLPRVGVPTLVAHARGDAVVPFAEGRLMASGIPGATFLPLESSDHVLLGEEPAFGEFMRAALRTVDGAAVGSSGPRSGTLTHRELEVLRLVASGAGNEHIAAQLHLSPRTVERHLSNTYAKLGLTGRSARAAAAAVVAQDEA